MKQLQHLLTKGLQATADLWPPLERAYGFVHQAAHILANPEQDTGPRVGERYRAHLAQMRDEIATLGPRDVCLCAFLPHHRELRGRTLSVLRRGGLAAHQQ